MNYLNFNCIDINNRLLANQKNTNYVLESFNSPFFSSNFLETMPNLIILPHPLLPNPNHHRFTTAFNRTKSTICFKTKQITLELMEFNSRAFYYNGPNKDTNRQIRLTLSLKYYCFLVEKHPIAGLNKTMKK